MSQLGDFSEAHNAMLNAMEECFRHLYGDKSVDAAIEAAKLDAAKSGKMPWNALSLKLKEMHPRQ